MGLSTHVLDTSTGRPASAMPLRLERRNTAGEFELLREAKTDADGRVKDLQPTLAAGIYRLTFDTKMYFGNEPSFYPSVCISFEVTAPTEHHHVPLLIPPFGFSTYRGS